MKLLTVDEVAERLAVCSKTVRNLISAHRIAHVRVGTALRVSEDALSAYVRAATVPARVR